MLKKEIMSHWLVLYGLNARQEPIYEDNLVI